MKELTDAEALNILAAYAPSILKASEGTKGISISACKIGYYQAQKDITGLTIAAVKVPTSDMTGSCSNEDE